MSLCSGCGERDITRRDRLCSGCYKLRGWVWRQRDKYFPLGLWPSELPRKKCWQQFIPDYYTDPYRFARKA